MKNIIFYSNITFVPLTIVVIAVMTVIIAVNVVFKHQNHIIIACMLYP